MSKIETNRISNKLYDDCPNYIDGMCQEYIDGDCYSHIKCDFKTIKKLQWQLCEKERECEKLKFTLKHTGLLDLMNKNVELRKALDEIKRICQIKEENSQFVLPSVWQQILAIINKAKE